MYEMYLTISQEARSLLTRCEATKNLEVLGPEDGTDRDVPPLQIRVSVAGRWTVQETDAYPRTRLRVPAHG